MSGFTDQHLFFDDVEIGQSWNSPARTVTEADIVNFAGLSGDYNPIHMDQAFAETTFYRQRIAHGLLVLSIGSGLVVNCPPMRTLAFMEVREWNFLTPVFIGHTIHLVSEIVEKTERARGRRGLIVWKRQIVNQDGAVVQEGKTVTLVEGRASLQKKQRN